jgi:hypothetical protein
MTKQGLWAMSEGEQSDLELTQLYSEQQELQESIDSVLEELNGLRIGALDRVSPERFRAYAKLRDLYIVFDANELRIDELLA